MSSSSGSVPINLNQRTKLQRTWRHFNKSRQLLILFLPALVFYIIFRYGPMFGLITAFQKYSPFLGIMKSPWVGLKYFRQFFSGYDFWTLFRNTMLLGFFTLIGTFPFPVIFALLLNEVKKNSYKRFVQTISYLPTFLSIVIVASMVIDFLSPTRGLINNILASFGFERIYFMIKPHWFRTIYVGSEIWQRTGFQAIIYLAALSGIDPTLYEAAHMDGAGRFRMMRNISLPCILPTVVVLFIIKSGNIIRIGFEKVLLLYNPATYSVADVFSTYVYRKGLVEHNFSYATAVGMFEAIVALALLLTTNYISKKVSQESLW